MPNGSRFYLRTNKPAKDSKFEVFRLRSVPIYDQFFKSLGATPVRMAPPDVFTGLECALSTATAGPTGTFLISTGRSTPNTSTDRAL